MAPFPWCFLGSSPNWLDVQTAHIVARAGKQAPKPKRAGRNLPDSPLFVSAKRRGGKGITGLKRRKPGSGKEEPPPFLARRMLFCPGMGPFGFRKLSLFAEPTEKNFSGIKPISFLNELEMIPFLFSAMEKNLTAALQGLKRIFKASFRRSLSNPFSASFSGIISEIKGLSWILPAETKFKTRSQSREAPP